jgi:hypothetical protein
MTLTLEYIKKLMGWCPNAKASETASRISPANFEECNRSGGEKARSPKILSQISRIYSRLDVRFLLPTLFITPFYINMLFRKGVNTEALSLGILLSLLIYLLCWKKQMKRYDALAKKTIIGSSSKKAYFRFFLVLISFFVLFMIFFPYMINFLSLQSIFSFLAGTWIIMWGNYFQLIYWERKNHMKIYAGSENGFQKMYTVREKEGNV